MTTIRPRANIRIERAGPLVSRNDEVRRQFAAVDWDFRGFVPSPKNSSLHSVHWYPAAFPPALVGTILDILGQKGHVVLDPFCGSAVVPIEAWIRSMKSYGFDSNRFVIDIGRAKADLIRRGTSSVAAMLSSHYSAFRKQEVAAWRGLSEPTICERTGIHPDATRWFTAQVLWEIAVLKKWITSSEAPVTQWRPALIVVLSAILHGRLSVVRNYHYTYVVDRSRVATECRDVTDVQRIFTEKLLAAFVDAELQREQVERCGVSLEGINGPELATARAQDLPTVLSQEVDLVITSPPYFGMNDYVRSQYLSWLVFQWEGYDGDLKNEIGSRRLRCSAKALEAYYREMEICFSGIHSVLRRDGRFVLVIGSSEGRFVNGTDPVTKLRELVSAQGFLLEWEGKRRVRFRKINNTPYRTEVLWVLSKP
jgi:hypothetical protein